VHLDIIKIFYSPSDAQVNCLKNNFKIYIKTDTDAFQLAILTTVTLTSKSNALPDDGVTAPKHVGTV
jgi:hypothetical protein